MTDLIDPLTDAEMHPVEDESIEADVEPSPEGPSSGDTPTPDSPSTPEPLTPPKRGLLRRLIRFTLLLGALAGLAVAIIYVAPIVNDRIIQPVETNTADTAELQSAVDDASSRIDDLEAQSVATGTDLDAVGATVDGLSETTGSIVSRLDDIDTLLAAQTTRIDDLDDLAATLGEELDTAQSATALEIEFLKSTELLSRARLFLYQANYGLAAQDVQSARDLLIALQADQGSDGPVAASTLADALTRIDLVLAALPGRPVAASDDLDIAWRLLLDEPLTPLVASGPATTPAETDVIPTTPPEN